jgi:hypothetical protein
MDIYTEEVLENLPTQLRKDFVNQSCVNYRRCILKTVAGGHTRRTLRIGAQRGMSPVLELTDPPSTEEILEYLRDTFLDYTVFYEEREKGILVTVDWS